MLSVRETAVLMAALGMVLLVVCSCAGDKDSSLSTRSPGFKRSFPLRQGRFSAITCLAADNQGYVYAAGFSDENCVLLKMDTELKTLIKMVRFGGTEAGNYFSQDIVKDMALDSQNNIFIAGYTEHKSFPVTKGGYDRHMSTKNQFGNEEGFIVKFSNDLHMLASTFIGGESRDRANAIAIDRHDDIYVTGFTCGTVGDDPAFIPPAGAYDSKPASHTRAKAFVARLSNDLGELKAATLLGGDQAKYPGHDEAQDLAIDREGNVWVTGKTGSKDFPVTPGCIGPMLAGESDAFVSKFDADLKHLLASTYIGGENNECANAIVVDGQGHIFVGGWSDSPDMLVFINGYDTTHSRNEEDAFIVKLDNRLSHMEAGTFIGGDGPPDIKGKTGLFPGDDKLACLALSDDGKTLYVAGRTESRDFDTTPPSRKNHYGSLDTNLVLDRSDALDDRNDQDYGDGFIARFDANLSTCISSVLLGGLSLEYIHDILIAEPSILVAGETNSVDFPGMEINYTINATRGFISLYDMGTSRKFSAGRPGTFKPQFTEAEIEKIANEIVKDAVVGYNKENLYSKLGPYAKDCISEDRFNAKVQREKYLYGGISLPALKYHHFNYHQGHKDGYDVIELYFREQDRNFFGNYSYAAGQVALIIIAKQEKWQLFDMQHRRFSLESHMMQKRLY